MTLWNCSNDDPISNFDPVDLDSCYSPEFGIIEDEQFFHDIEVGELQVDLGNNITTNNVGYSIEEGSSFVFVYRHFLENSFNIEDDEVEIRLLFQVDGNLNSLA